MHISHKIVGLLGIVIFVSIGAYFILTSSKAGQNLDAIVPEKATPSVWIEILEDTVSTDQKDLESGDKILVGTTIISSNTGRAVLHFPDSSIATIDPNTTVTLDESLYTPDDKGIVSKIFLSTGKIFFSITELATPESKWEVKTGNAVAVVRGTAFSVAYNEGVSEVAVTENSVSVATLDPETNEAIPGTEVLVEENATALILDEDAKNGTAPSITRTNVPPLTTPETQVEQIASPEPVIASPTPQSLTVTGTPTGRVTEGDIIQFTAIITFDDGTSRDVTQEANWEVLGTIGSVSNTGVFEADIPPDVSEFGVSSGAVIATWNDTATSDTLLGQTEIFEVNVFFEVTEDRRG